MDTNKALEELGYGQRTDFADIARWVAAQQRIKAFKDINDLKQRVEAKFGKVAVRQGMLAETKPYTTFLAPELPVESETYNQLKMALSLPVSVDGSLMPDAHPGYSLPIGGVVRLDHAISPAFVGYDIACQMHLTVFQPDIQTEALNKENTQKRFLQWVLKSTSFGLGSATHGLDHPVMANPLWNEVPELKKLKRLAAEQVGSSGAGNHFADVVVGETLEDGSLFGEKGSRWIALMTHSGSRGVGNKLAHYYAEMAEKQTADRFKVARGYGWLDLRTELGQEYLAVMNLMGDYALANHELIHAQFLHVSGLNALATVANQHNFAWVLEDGTVIHRKGATPAGKGVMGIIPGSSGSSSFIVEGLGNQASLESASHGAGRPRSRSASKANYNDQAFQRHMGKLGITHYGVAPDEVWTAYKPIELVMQAQSELVRPVAQMAPKVVVMGGLVRSDDGD